MAKKKGSNTATKNEVQSVANALAKLRKNLDTKLAPQKQKQKKGKKKNKNKRVRYELPNVANLGVFARAFLDPFGTRGVQVPDSSLIKTAKSWTHYYIGASGGPSPIWNFTGTVGYVSLVAAPIFDPSIAPIRFWSSPSNTSSFFDFSGSTTPGTADYTKHFGWNMNTNNRGPVITNIQQFRVGGGGLKLKINGVQPTTPVDVYAIPMFNGDRMMSQYNEVMLGKVRHWHITQSDETIVIPWPVRSTENAFEWVDGAKTGANLADYPVDDPAAAGSLFNNLANTPSTDCTTTDTGVYMWSLQSGLGGWQIVFNVPQTTGWCAESIVHTEVNVKRAGTNIAESDSISSISLADHQQLETVGNLVAMSCTKDETVRGGTSSPIVELTKELGTQAMNGLTGALRDSQILKKVSYAGARVASHYFTGGANPFMIMG